MHANSIATLAAILERMEKRLDEDRKERKAESDAIAKIVSRDRANAEMTRSAVSADLNVIRLGQTDVLRRLDKIEPVINLVTSFRSMVTGGLILLGVIGTVVWSAATFFKELILGLFQ